MAVILMRRAPLVWIDALTTAVKAGSFVVPRTILDGVTFSEIADFISTTLRESPLSPEAASGLRDDLLDLVSRCAELTNANRFRFRFFTDIPNCRCSYHVDVVPPKAPTTALLQVFCGARTEYVSPANLKSWEEFYSWEFLRKQQVVALSEARAYHDLAGEERSAARLERLDARLSFLVRPAPPEVVPANTIVACKFVDSQYLWDCTHLRARSARGWIHRSPMVGDSRCVASVSAIA
jgi:hypothetical protein